VELDGWPGPNFIEILASATAALEATSLPNIPLLPNAVSFRLGSNMLQQLEFQISHGVDRLFPWPNRSLSDLSNSTREHTNHMPAFKTHLLSTVASQITEVLGAIRAVFAPIHHMCLDFRALRSDLDYDLYSLIRDGLTTSSLRRASLHGLNWPSFEWTLCATDTTAYMVGSPQDPRNDRYDDYAATFGKKMESWLFWNTDSDQPTFKFVYANTTRDIGLCEDEHDFLRRVRKKVLDSDVEEHFLKALSEDVYRRNNIDREGAIKLFDRISNRWDEVLQFSHIDDTSPCPLCLSEFTLARDIAWNSQTAFDLDDVS